MYRVSAAAAVPAVGTTTGDRECVWPWALAGLPGVGRAYGLRCDGPSDLPKKELWKHKLGACVVACGSGASGASEPHSAMVCCSCPSSELSERLDHRHTAKQASPIFFV